jgi:hypothetical protein
LGQYPVLNQPSPFRLNAVAEIIFSTEPPHWGHSLAGTSENFWRSSNWQSHVEHRYSYIGIAYVFLLNFLLVVLIISIPTCDCQWRMDIKSAIPSSDPTAELFFVEACSLEIAWYSLLNGHYHRNIRYRQRRQPAWGLGFWQYQVLNRPNLFAECR